MTLARRRLVDTGLTRFYHCISRCVRRARLCGDKFAHRKEWLERRLEELAEIYAISVAGYAILDNHLHVLVRIDSEQVEAWSDREVALRWGKLYPPRDARRRPMRLSEEWLEQRLKDAAWIQRARDRLANLGWFMKCLKEPLARQANREDGCHGTFWESRYKSIAILDEQSLLATCAYIDLNPVAAGKASLPERSNFTSIRTRVDHCRKQGRLGDLQVARQGSIAATWACRGIEDGLWLCPIENSADAVLPEKAGLLDGLSLGVYLQLIDWTSRLRRDGKARVGAEVREILDRLGTNAESWRTTLHCLFTRARATGVVFAFTRARLKYAASRRGCHHVANLNGCPT